MLPSRKPVAHQPDARPRRLGGDIRTSSDKEETVNIVDPMPPTTRRVMSCQYCAANGMAAFVIATTATPTRNPGSSPNRAITRPAAGANTSRDSANTLTTNDAAVIPTSNVRTKTGRIGATIP